MASASVVLTSDTSGSVTVTVPSGTALGTTTLTLPTTGGTIQTSGSGFTTNGVAYASSTSALATGSVLQFNGTELGVGVTPTTGSPVAIQASTGNTAIRLIGTSNGSTSNAGIYWYDSNNTTFNGYFGNFSTSFDFYNQRSTPIVFYTNAAEAMRITSSGNLLVGLTSSADIAGTTTNGWMIKNNQIQHTSSGTLMYLTTSTSGSQTFVSFYSQTSAVGSITTTGSTTAYLTFSDYRLKENVQPMTGALAKVAQLKPVTYKWKASGFDGEGFIAHELAEVVPECVHGSKDEVDADGNPKYQGVDTSFLVATLTSALQELSTLITVQSATITSLTERITALEGART